MSSVSIRQQRQRRKKLGRLGWRFYQYLRQHHYPTGYQVLRVSNKVIVLFGGPLVNEAVHYYESNGIAPLHWGLVGGFVSGTEYYYNCLGQPVASVSLSVLGPEVQDMGLIEAFTDQNGNTVMIFSGFDWQGTFVSGLYFKTVLTSRLSTMTDSWYIYSWSDSNGNGFAEVSEVNSTPVNHGV